MGRKDTHQKGDRSYLMSGREGGVGFSRFILYTCDIKNKKKVSMIIHVSMNYICLKEAIKCLRFSFNR